LGPDFWWTRCVWQPDWDGRELTGLQDLKSAEKFYQEKVTDLTNNLKDLETIVQRKQQNARTIEEGMLP
jgi:hypothetical protein